MIKASCCTEREIQLIKDMVFAQYNDIAKVIYLS